MEDDVTTGTLPSRQTGHPYRGKTPSNYNCEGYKWSEKPTVTKPIQGRERCVDLIQDPASEKKDGSDYQCKSRLSHSLKDSTSISTLEGDNVLYTAKTAPVPVQPYDEGQQ
ncbi:hypothetical protein F7725_021863 [Dissostichus mawsoni]|uniref:Uncharacterized protein n=1 Tax=Dissostichus mawsoni TaxID=36200 RepID=A0A7J5ZCE2_DISMA|nr:hypothetical protein F7725_021863 [Dissostichus mawsoni]